MKKEIILSAILLSALIFQAKGYSETFELSPLILNSMQNHKTEATQPQQPASTPAVENKTQETQANQNTEIKSQQEENTQTKEQTLEQKTELTTTPKEETTQPKAIEPAQKTKVESAESQNTEVGEQQTKNQPQELKAEPVKPQDTEVPETKATEPAQAPQTEIAKPQSPITKATTADSKEITKIDESGYKTITIKDKNDNVIKTKQYNEKGLLIEEIEYNNNISTRSIYSYRTGKLNQQYVSEGNKISSLTWFNINNGKFIAKTIIGNNGTSKTYNYRNDPFTGTVLGHRYGQDYELKYKDGDVVPSSIFDALVKIGIIDAEGKFLVEPYYYFKFLSRLAIIDNEWNSLDKKAMSALNGMVDKK